MKNKLVLVFVGCLVTMSVAFADTASDQAARSSQIMAKIVKLDMCNFVLPLAMSKSQYGEVLTAVEKTRDRIRKTEKLEADELKKIEGEIDKALSAAVDEGKIPTTDFRNKIGSMFKKFDVIRQMNAQISIKEVYDVCMKVWNAGQQKVAANSIDPRNYDPKAKVDEMKDEEKIKMFVSEIILNEQSYSLMVKLAAK